MVVERVQRILMPVLWYDETPGGWTFFAEIARMLSKQGNKVIVLTPHTGRGDDYGSNPRVYRFKSTYIQAVPIYLVNFVSLYHALFRIRNNEGPIDLVYDTTSGLLPCSIACKIWFKLYRIRVPLVTHVHGELRDFARAGFLSILFEAYLNIIARFTFCLSEKILVAGDRIYPRVVQLGAPSQNVMTIRLGARFEDREDLHDAKKRSDIRRRLRRDMGIDDRDFLIGYVGRLTKGKGVDQLIRAFGEASKRRARQKLILVGDGRDREILQGLVRDLGLTSEVIFLGHRSDVLELLCSMDVFVNLSKSEAGISASQIEAMQMGLATVVTPFSDLLVNGRDALVVGREDISGAASAILRLYDDESLRALISQNAIKRAAEMNAVFSWARYLDQVSRVFQEVGSR